MSRFLLSQMRWYGVVFALLVREHDIAFGVLALVHVGRRRHRRARRTQSPAMARASRSFASPSPSRISFGAEEDGDLEPCVRAFARRTLKGCASGPLIAISRSRFLTSNNTSTASIITRTEDRQDAAAGNKPIAPAWRASPSNADEPA